MTAEELWKAFKADKHIDADAYEAWTFGSVPDKLLGLVLQGEKTATASAYDLYAIEGDALPCEGCYSVILNAKGEARCVIRTTKVTIVPFKEVTPEHARKEGEGDKSLTYWRQVHQEVLEKEFAPYGLSFSEDTPVVCEEFELLYQ